MRLLTTSFLLLFAVAAFGYFFWYKPTFKKITSNSSVPVAATKKTTNNYIKIKNGVKQLKQFAKLKNYNTNYCFWIDMHIPSGQNRFFVYNFKKDTVELAGLVAHGSGSESDDDDLHFCNTPNSLATLRCMGG